MALLSADITAFDAFLTKYGYSVDDADKPSLLALSFAFLGTLEFCIEADAITTEAQCFIAYSMTSQGGGFSPSGVIDSKTLVEKGLGRSAIVKKWKVDDSLTGTDSLSMLKTIPMAYNLLKSLLCSTGADTAVFDLIR